MSRQRRKTQARKRATPTTAKPATKRTYKLPQKPSVASFAEWMIGLGHGGETPLTKLYLEFCETRDLAGWPDATLKSFKRGLLKAGYRIDRDDKHTDDGVRSRLLMVQLSVPKVETAANGNVTRLGVMAEKRVPKPSMAVPRVEMQTRKAA